MKTRLPDGRIFETLPFLRIEYDPREPVYQFIFETKDREVKSSSRHLWAIWNSDTKNCELMRMDLIDVEKHELLVQGWDL